MKKYLPLVMISIVCFSCKKTSVSPVSCFTQDKSTTNVGEAVQFSNCSSNIGTVKWDFGDGSGSTENSPSHTWTSGGTYTVKLTVYGTSGGNGVESSASIVVNGGNGNVSTNPGSFSRFSITKVEILGFPAKKVNGQDWDSDSPDMYVALVPAGSQLNYSTTSIYDDFAHYFYNVTSISQLKWDYSNNPFLVNFPSSGGFAVDVYLFDYDYNSIWLNEVMAKIPAVDLYNTDNYGKPSLTFTQASFSVRFTLTWQ